MVIGIVWCADLADDAGATGEEADYPVNSTPQTVRIPLSRYG